MIGRIQLFRPAKTAPGAVDRSAPPASAPLAAANDSPLSREEGERFKALMLPHLDGAYAYARFLCRDAALAEDLVQDAFLRAYRGFRGFRGGEPRAWLFAIVRSGFLSWVRSPARRATESEDKLAVQASEGDTPEAALLRRSEADGVRAAIDALPEPFRETLVLRELEELSYRQVSEVTGVPIGTVMSRLARARQLLLAALQEDRP